MKSLIRLSLVAVAASALVACSGPALGGGKEGAAQAAFHANKAANSSTSQQAMNALATGIISGSVTVACMHGGNVKLSLDLDGLLSSNNSDSGSLGFAYDVEYDECNQDGRNELDGEMTVGFYLDFTSNNLSFKTRMVGEVDISGEVDDFIDVDVTQAVEISANSATATISLRMTGTIETREGVHTYNETDGAITFVNGPLPVAPEN